MNKLQLYTNSEFDPLRLRQDPLADQAVKSLIGNPDWITTINNWEYIPTTLPEEFNVELTEFFTFYLQRLDHAQEQDLKPGQDFFAQKGDLYLAMLGFYSLPYCYAFGDGAEVLVRSQRIVNQIGERLGETGSFVLGLFEPGAFYQLKSTFLLVAKVRLIHAFSRYFIKHYVSDWKIEYGQPVNQEDMLGTNLAFSFIVLRGMIKMGKNPSENEQQAVLRYWKWIGELMGIDISYWPESSKEAFELDKLIRRRQLKESEAGKILINSLVRFYEQTIPDDLLKSQLNGILSFFLGKEAAEALGLSERMEIPGDILGWMFGYLGWKNYGGKKGFPAIRQNLELQHKRQFGRVLGIQLPVLTRS